MEKKELTQSQQAKEARTRLPVARILAQASLRKFAIFIGYFGILLVVYGTLGIYWAVDYPTLERLAVFASSLLTVLGAILTAVGIYLPLNKKPPELFSLYISAPTVIACGVLAIVYLVVQGSIPSHIVNGFALMAIAGAIFRIQEKPELE